MNSKWKINSLKSKPSDGSVIAVNWQVTVSKEEEAKTQYGKLFFKTNPSDPSFIPYDDLTEETVLDWVWTSLNKDEVETDLYNKLTRQSEYEIGRPW